MHRGATRTLGNRFTGPSVHAGPCSFRFDNRLPLDCVGINRCELKSTIWNSYLQIFRQDVYDNPMSRFQPCKVF